jgi:lysyl-tRNA synthetase class 2
MSPGSKNNLPSEEQRRLSARKPHLRLRAGILQAVRSFFRENEYLEIETPHLIPSPAPELHIDAVASGDAFLHTSPELCMKRMLCAEYPRIFQICRCFRKGERGARHLPEFTLLEWYRAGIDYMGLMEECEEMIRFAARGLGFGERLVYQGREIDLRGPWTRLSVQDAFERYASLSMGEALATDRFDELMVVEIEPRLGTPRPAFLYDYPVSRAALARTKTGNPGLAERFELYMGGGLELANAFSELNDPQEQRERFEKEMKERERLGKTPYPLPEKFLDALLRMPPSAGIALGVDRLVMIFADTPNIDDVVSFTPEEL